MARSHATLIFAAALVVNVLLLSQSRLTGVTVQQQDGQDFKGGVSSFRRGLFVAESGGSGETVRPHPGFIWNLSFIEPFRLPGFARDTEPVDNISVDPSRCPLTISARMSNKNVRARIPFSLFIIPNGISALNQQPGGGPSPAWSSGLYSFSRHSA